jgi:hypothetical protein
MLLQFKKAYSPTVVTEGEIVIGEARLRQPEKILFSIVFSMLGIIAIARPVQPEKAPAPILSTVRIYRGGDCYLGKAAATIKSVLVNYPNRRAYCYGIEFGMISESINSNRRYRIQGFFCFAIHRPRV